MESSKKTKVREYGGVSLGIGCAFKFMIDDSMETEEKCSRWTEMTYDGKPGSDIVDVPIHWHKYQDEYMEVLYGKAKFVLEGQEKILEPESGVLYIPRYARHGFSVYPGIATSIKEYTTPSDVGKDQFFKEMFEHGQGAGLFQAMRACYNGDAYIVMPGNIRFIDHMVVTILGGIAKMLGW